MPVQSIIRLYDTSEPPEEIGIRINGVGKDGFMEVLYADIPGNSWNQNRLDLFTARAQDMIDIIIPLDDPSLVDDPAGPNGEDPNRPDFFWDGTPPNGDLVSRPILISDVFFIEPIGPLMFTLTRAE